MDQVKQILSVMKKHHFWILTGLIAILCSVGYVMARMALSTKITTRIAAIDGQFNAVKGVQGEAATHPNSHSHNEMDLIVKKISDDVKIAWEYQYNRQSKILVWPEDALAPDMKQITLEKLMGLLPIETKLPFPIVEPQTLIMKERNVYRDYIENRFPQLAKIIDSEWMAKMRVSQSQGMGGMGGGMGPGGMGGGMGGMSGGMGPGGMGGGLSGGSEGSGSDEGGYGMGTRTGSGKVSTVNWSPASQQELMDAICYWYDPRRPPNTAQICYTQEDLWILEAILRIIATTNDGAKANFQAAIKEIEFIRFGSAAMSQSGSIIGMAPGGIGGGYGGMSDEGGMGSSGGSGGLGGPPGMGLGDEGSSMSGGSGTAGAERDPADNRYIDDKFKPILGADLRTAMASSSPTDAPVAVAKRIPVRLKFSKMDQRKLNRLIAECGNGGSVENPRLVLEVRQVRVNGAVSAGGMGGMGGMAGGMGPGMGGMGPGMGGMGPGMGGMGGGLSGSEGGGSDGLSGGSGGAASAPASSMDVPIEIYGVIYLYNPVDMEKLGLANVTADTNLEAGINEAGAGNAPPAAAPPTDTAPVNPPPTDTPADAPAAPGTDPLKDPGPGTTPPATPPGDGAGAPPPGENPGQ